MGDFFYVHCPLKKVVSSTTTRVHEMPEKGEAICTNTLLAPEMPVVSTLRHMMKEDMSFNHITWKVHSSN